MRGAFGASGSARSPRLRHARGASPRGGLHSPKDRLDGGRERLGREVGTGQGGEGRLRTGHRTPSWRCRAGGAQERLDRHREGVGREASGGQGREGGGQVYGALVPGQNGDRVRGIAS